MTDKNAQKLIDKIIGNLETNGVEPAALIGDLKALRPYAVKEKRPIVAKAIRLVYEHLEEFDTFAITIPEDDDIIDEETGDVLAYGDEVNSGPTESLIYLMSLIRNEEHKRNKEEIRVFNEELKDYADEYGDF